MKHSAKAHPYCLPAEALRGRLGAGTPLGDAETQDAKLRLPATRSGPLPSPELSHDWHLDTVTRPFLSPWIVSGLFLTPAKAFGVLINLPEEGHSSNFIIGQDVRFWRMAANLVLEVLAGQKVAPVLVPEKDNGDSSYYARWQPVLDGPHDGTRLAQLATAMPPVCRCELLHPNGRYRGGDERSPQALLDSFLKAMVDALVRSWGKSAAPQTGVYRDDPFLAWLTALFQEDATVRATPHQLHALNSSLRAWLRNLQIAGDSVFRIAFRLNPPTEQTTETSKDWEMHYLLQARDDPSLLIPAEEVWRRGGSALQSLGRRFDHPQEKLLAGLGYAARIFPPLRPALQTSHPSAMNLDTKEAYTFLRESLPLLEQAGFAVLTPPWWNKPNARLGVRLRLRPLDQSGPKLSRGKLGLDHLVSYHWELSLGETTLSRQDFEALVALKSPLVQVNGQWVQLDSDQIEAAIRFWDTQQQSGEMELLKAAKYGLGGLGDAAGLPLTEVVAEDWVEEWMERLSNPDRVHELAQPLGMQGALRPYQRYGFSWLAFFRRWGLGACLADDMGLGKTIQALALLQHDKENGDLKHPVLLVCPTSVVTNWQREAARFTPGLTTMLHQGPNRLRNEEFVLAAKKTDLVLTSYAVLRLDAELLQKVKWQGVIVDEAQNIKNPSAKQTQAARKLPAGFRLALTGTPVENRLSELWSIMQFLNPGYLASLENFRREFAIPIERFSDRDATTRLRQMVSPFILRRLKSDPRIIQDLPEKIEMKEYCYLTEEQATLYQAVVQDTMKQINESEGLARKGLVLRLLMQLKQICNHPAQYMHQVEAAIADDSQIDGRSGKLARLAEMLEEILAEGDRTLIFTQFAEMGKLLAAYLPNALGCAVQFLHGETPFRQREMMVTRFMEDEHGPPIFILSLKAGGTGLNLMRANHVFHFDRWWNPAVEDQATDRAYRIGQHQNVQVRKLVTTGTLEERIDGLIEAKKGLADAIIGGGEDWLTELTTEELRNLVELR